jgi:hypothetical protein
LAAWQGEFMDLDELLRTALDRATAEGLLGVKAKHLTRPELDELVAYCVDVLWEKRTEQSPIADGWWYSAGGIRPWWEKAAQLNEREALSLRSLRTEVYDVLEERRLIVKGPGNNVPIHVAPPQVRSTSATTEVITVAPSGAGYGDPLTNAKVEAAAMDLVATAYAAAGWAVSDVSMQKVGWDITVNRADQELHLEVKGVSGSKPTVLLTRNEYATAETDPAWRLVVVTQALTNPTLTEFPSQQVVAASKPHVFRVQLA